MQYSMICRLLQYYCHDTCFSVWGWWFQWCISVIILVVLVAVRKNNVKALRCHDSLRNVAGTDGKYEGYSPRTP